jgi:hypothetical protein
MRDDIPDGISSDDLDLIIFFDLQPTMITQNPDRMLDIISRQRRTRQVLLSLSHRHQRIICQLYSDEPCIRRPDLAMVPAHIRALCPLCASYRGQRHHDTSTARQLAVEAAELYSEAMQAYSSARLNTIIKKARKINTHKRKPSLNKNINQRNILKKKIQELKLLMREKGLI